MRLAALLALLAILVAAAACGGGSKATGNGATPAAGDAISARLNSLVGHINAGDGKAILDDDVPASARRTCSDSDAKTLVNTVRQQTNGKLAVESVSNVSVSGSKATAAVVLGIAGAPAPPAITLPFVKDGSSWKFDTSFGEGCAELIPNGVS